MKLKYLLILSLLFSACKKQGGKEENFIRLLSVTVNGVPLEDGALGVPVNPELRLSFDAALGLESIISAVSIHSGSGDIPLNISMSNANATVVIKANLTYDTDYTLTVDDRNIGKNSGHLKNALTIAFQTLKDDTIRSAPPCTSGCLETASFNTGTGGLAKLDFYRNYPVFEEKVKWENLTSAIIVVHGTDRNANDYFSYLNLALGNAGLENSTVVIAPLFKDQPEAAPGDLYWDTNDWREGQNSDDATKLSSFSVVDSLIKQLANKNRFPVLNKIIITGHSSGALFTHLFAGASHSEPLYPDIDFKYIVANSQYFYYPNDYRYNEQTQSFYIPSNCSTFNHWPMGFINRPPYLNGTNEDDFNNHFIKRNITYLLGNGSATDPSLNTTNCAAVLLGSSRYRRGENMFRFMQNHYSGQHNHSKVIVEGIGHDGKGMYQSPEFKNLITQLLN